MEIFPEFNTIPLAENPESSDGTKLSSETVSGGTDKSSQETINSSNNVVNTGDSCTPVLWIFVMFTGIAVYGIMMRRKSVID